MLELSKLQAEVELLKADAMERQAKAQLDMAKIGTEQVKAGQIQSDTDLKNLDYVEQESGVKQERDLQKGMAQAQGNIALEREKVLHQKEEKDKDRKFDLVKEMIKLNDGFKFDNSFKETTSCSLGFKLFINLL